jgi:hypothetical protein
MSESGWHQEKPTEWKCRRNPPRGRIETSNERLILECSCRRESEKGEGEYLALEIFELNSASDAAKSLRGMRAGLELTGRSSEPHKIGDEGYLTRFKIADTTTVAIYLRKNETVVYVGGNLLSNVKKFAEFIEQRGEKEFRAKFLKAERDER